MARQTTGSIKNGDSPTGPRSSTRRSIFRAEALQHYTQNQDKVVLPNLVSPRIFINLWVIAALLIGAGLLLAFWPWIAS